MSRTQRAVIVPITLLVILMAAALGTLLGTVAPHEWDLFPAQIQGRSCQISPGVPATNARTTLYVLDTSWLATREVMVDLRMPGHGYGSGLSSVPILLTTETGVVEMPLDSGVVLRMELVPSTLYTDDELEPAPLMPLLQVAEQ